MTRYRHLLAGFLVTLALTAVTAVFSAWPTHRPIPPGTAVLKVSLSHAGDRSAACRELTAAELARLPPNMRQARVCERRRPPLYIELDIDGTTVLSAILPPGGIAGDGPSRLYRRFVLPSGEHEIAVRLRDTPRADGFDHAAARRIALVPAQSLAIDFRPGEGGFVFN